jgi:hypothetical protein
MSTGAIVAIVIVVIVVAAVVAAVMMASRRRRLKERFGPEYDRAVTESGSRREAEAELAGRERHHRELGIRPLSPAARAQYSSEWTAVQEQFVDAPQAAVTGAQTLVSAVMEDRGYPTQPYDQTLADLSVEHASTLDHFRAAHDISQNAAAGTASTEDLRQAMIHYRALFAELLGEPVDQAGGPGVSTTQPDGLTPEADETPVTPAQEPAAVTPVDEPAVTPVDEPAATTVDGRTPTAVDGRTPADTVSETPDEPAPDPALDPTPDAVTTARRQER